VANLVKGRGDALLLPGDDDVVLAAQHFFGEAALEDFAVQKRGR
jgi:hypothetical protein